MANVLMPARQEVWRTAAAIVATLVVWGAIRLVFPSLDYYPPDGLVQSLRRSWFVISGTHKAAQVVYALGALTLMAVFFAVLQRRWPGRRGWNGLTFGVLLGFLWTLGFLTSSAFFGTRLGAELLNGILDLAALGLGGWLIGLALGHDVPRAEHESGKPWFAILPVACGFVTVHTLGATMLHAPLGRTAALLPWPETTLQYATLFMVGLGTGVMYVILRTGLPFGPTWANAAFFAFGVFGHSWTWFKLYLVIELSGVFFPVLLIGFIGSLGVFVGVFAYEWAARA
jgi:hypothetical protein